MKLRQFIANIISEHLSESDNPSDYTSPHTAPTKSDDAPMYDVGDMFPDMYTGNALKYYGIYGLDDASVIYQIQSVHNKPNKLVKIYRAVPNPNRDVDKQIEDLNYILKYRIKFKFFPMKNQIVQKLEKDIWENEPSLSYDEMQTKVVDKIYGLINDLTTRRVSKFKINNGDWVTTSKMYAKQHGESNLNNNYKIVTKTVKASQLYTDGNSIFEWGYNL